MLCYFLGRSGCFFQNCFKIIGYRRLNAMWVRRLFEENYFWQAFRSMNDRHRQVKDQHRHMIISGNKIFEAAIFAHKKSFSPENRRLFFKKNIVTGISVEQTENFTGFDFFKTHMIIWQSCKNRLLLKSIIHFRQIKAGRWSNHAAAAAIFGIQCIFKVICRPTANAHFHQTSGKRSYLVMKE